jgi:hypothetical protein
VAPDIDAILAAGHPLLHRLAIIAAAGVGGRLIARDARAWPLPWASRWIVLAAVGLGSLAGATLPGLFAGGAVGSDAAAFVVSQPDMLHAAAAEYLLGPKTVVGGLLLGFVAAVVVKPLFAIRAETSDAFARGTCAMMAIGRLGCIAQHCCFGVVLPPSWAWLGWDLGDGLPRLPVQAFEAVLLFALWYVIERLHRRGALRDRRLFLFFAVYGAGRFLLEFGREPIATVQWGLGYYQWLAALLCGIGLYRLVKPVAAAPAVATGATPAG